MDNTVYIYPSEKCVATSHFKFSIYSTNLLSRQIRHAQTLKKRGESVPVYYVQINGEIQSLGLPIFF